MRGNVLPLLGNHDATAAYLLGRLNVQVDTDNCETQIKAEDLRALARWLSDGGDTTLAEFRSLSPDERECLLDYLSEFTPYEELSVGGQRFVLVHGGLPDFEPARPLCDYPAADMLVTRPDYTRRYFNDRYLVTGHTPTCEIPGAQEGRIYRANGHIAIDCGAGFGMPLGCLRLEDLQEFYVV